MYPIYFVINIRESQFQSISLYNQPFQDTGIFWDKCTKQPPNDLEPYKAKCTPYMYHKYPRVSNCTPFCCTTSRFRDPDHFEKRTPNDPKMTLSSTRSKVPYIYMYICVTNVPDSQNSPNFPLRPRLPEVFTLQAVSRLSLYLLCGLLSNLNCGFPWAIRLTVFIEIKKKIFSFFTIVFFLFQ